MQTGRYYDQQRATAHLILGPSRSIAITQIQAKRWTGLVGLESVHALTGVMADHDATTGVLVITSWFDRASEQFANRDRITLLNGAELKQLIRDYLHKDVIPGTSPPNGSERQAASRPAALALPGLDQRSTQRLFTQFKGHVCTCRQSPLRRHHHRCKQATGWRLEQPEPGVLKWRTPAGRTYVTGPARYPA